AAVEADSEHPLARAIVTAAGEHGGVPRARNFNALTGRGVTADVDGVTYAVGGPALLRERQLQLPSSLRDQVSTWESRGASVLYLTTEHEIVGAITLEDEIRPEAREAVAELREMGVNVA